MIFLIDGDNNITNDLNGIEYLSKDDTVLIFHKKGMDLSKIKKRMESTKASVQYIESVKAGKNALDFQIVSELGVLIGAGKVRNAYIISQDKGYSAAIKSLQTRYPDAFTDIGLKSSIEECLTLPYYLLKADSKSALSNILNKEFGTEQGSAIYAHLKTLFSANTPQNRSGKPSSKTNNNPSSGSTSSQQ